VGALVVVGAFAGAFVVPGLLPAGTPGPDTVDTLATLNPATPFPETMPGEVSDMKV
jgi:hypothetical protein